MLTQRAVAMFLVEWFQSLLYQLGFFSKDATVLLVGLDNAGKTTIVCVAHPHLLMPPCQPLLSSSGGCGLLLTGLHI